MQTLKGIFPEKKSNHRKNFIKENVRRIKQLQEYSSQGALDMQEKPMRPQYVSTQVIKSNLSQMKLNEPDPKINNKGRRIGIQKLEIKPSVKRTPRKEPEKDEHIVHRSMQTETSDNIDSIYSTGVIKYPSPPILNSLQKKDRAKLNNVKKKPDPGHGDTQANDDNRDKVDYIKQNMQIKGKSNKKGDVVDPGRAPNNYKKGVVPKYIKQRKEQPSEDTADVDCPQGHVLLPEEERKETLKVLRESYAEKIQELNSMPVRSDTLKMQKRKIALEEELKKIDEGIKVFQRPKVFVRICV